MDRESVIKGITQKEIDEGLYKDLHESEAD